MQNAVRTIKAIDLIRHRTPYKILTKPGTFSLAYFSKSWHLHTSSKKGRLIAANKTSDRTNAMPAARRLGLYVGVVS
jgi:hypothetical protein